MFSEDLSLFFDIEGGFAVSAAFARAGNPIVETAVIFTAVSQSVALYDTNVEEPNPSLRVPTALIADVRRGDTVTIESSDYRVEQITDDGTGVSMIYLST